MLSDIISRKLPIFAAYVKELFVFLDKSYDMEKYLEKKQYEKFIKIIKYGPFTRKIVNFKEKLKYAIKSL